MTTEQTFLKYSADKITQHSDRILKCLDKLTPEQVWMRQSENENAVGNLVLHLCGNLRQWIGFGVAGKADIRVRDREFAARGGVEVDDLKQRLSTTVKETADIIAQLPTERLGQMTKVQSYELTVLEAIYHVVEHFSGHAGQIIFATKLMTSEDLAFYGHLKQQSHTQKVP